MVMGCVSVGTILIFLLQNKYLSLIITILIHHIFSLEWDWSKHVMWPNIPQLKLADIQECSPIFKTLRIAKKIWRITNTIHKINVASIWGKNVLGYLQCNNYLPKVKWILVNIHEPEVNNCVGIITQVIIEIHLREEGWVFYVQLKNSTSLYTYM